MAASVAKERPVVVYNMPDVYVGDVVNYYPDGSGAESSACCARVVRVSTGSIELRAEMAEGKILRCYDVLHVEDPRLASASDRLERGAWDYAHQTRDLLDLQARVAALEDLITKK